MGAIAGGLTTFLGASSTLLFEASGAAGASADSALSLEAMVVKRPLTSSGLGVVVARVISASGEMVIGLSGWHRKHDRTTALSCVNA